MVSLNRRDVLKGALGVFATWASSPVLSAQQDRMVVIDGGGSNVLAVSTGDGLVLVDGGAPKSFDKVMSPLGANARVAALFNTHHHADQTGNNERFPAGTKLTIPGVLAYSSNIGTIRIAQKLGKEKMVQYQRAFGLGQATNEGMPGEASGKLLAPDEWSGSAWGSVPIGMSVDATLIQMASGYAAIANDGHGVSIVSMRRNSPRCTSGAVTYFSHRKTSARPSASAARARARAATAPAVPSS